MIKVNKLINLSQLDKEYNGEGLLGILDENDNLVAISLAENNSGNETELKAVLDKHIAIQNKADKTALLAKLGISEDEAKLLLS